MTLDHLARALATPPRPVGSSDYDLNPDIRSGLPAGRVLRDAAVLVPIVPRDTGLGVVLTRRSAALRHHPGQIAFPGGKMDAGDPSLWHAALREAHEEIGLDPALVTPLGMLERHETVTSFTVQPHVGLLLPGHTLAPSEDEVAEVFEVPLDFLMNPAHFQTHNRRWKGITRQYYAVPYGPYYIWGATAQMLKGLADRVASL